MTDLLAGEDTGVETFLAEYIRRTNSHTFDEVEPLIDADAVFWFSSGSHRGLAAIRNAFERTWGVIRDEVYSVEDVDWLTFDEASATCIYTFRWRGIINGTASEGSGRGTTVLRKDGGRWRVVHEHLSARP